MHWSQASAGPLSWWRAGAHDVHREAERAGQIGDLTAFCSYPMRGYREDEARLFSGSYGNRMRGAGHKLQHGKIPFRYMEKQITMRVIKY